MIYAAVTLQGFYSKDETSIYERQIVAYLTA